jgi:hypothetical protein
MSFKTKGMLDSSHPLEYGDSRAKKEKCSDQLQQAYTTAGFRLLRSEVINHMWKSPIKMSDLDSFIKNLSSTIESDPMALHSMCLKAGFLVMKDNLEEAKTIFLMMFTRLKATIIA